MSDARELERRGRIARRTVEPVGDWRGIAERGSVLGIKATVVVATMFGRTITRGLVALIALYYTLVSSTARRSVTDFRRRLGLPTGFSASYRHVLRFAQCALDALFFLRGKVGFFEVTRNGHEHLDELRRTRTSAILLGGHIGSFYAMRQQSQVETLPLYPVQYTRNAKRFNAVLRELDPSTTTRLIEVGAPGDVDFILAIREKLEHGALVAILGDRMQADSKTVEVDFLGSRALFPAGPYFLAATLKQPVYFTCGLYRGGAHYELFCIPFADRIELPRGQRMEAVQAYAQQYADLLARFCREQPDNWFNFYDFWSEEPDE